MSGWTLEISGHRSAAPAATLIDPATGNDLPDFLARAEPRPLLGRVPDGTLIAPGGMLLLGFNKYDFGTLPTEVPDPLSPTGFSDVDIPGLGAFERNGIGLTNRVPFIDFTATTGSNYRFFFGQQDGDPADGFFSQLLAPGNNFLPGPTYPPIPMIDPSTNVPYDPIAEEAGPGGSLPDLSPVPRSVFYRGLGADEVFDFLDYNGDGVDDAELPFRDATFDLDRYLRDRGISLAPDELEFFSIPQLQEPLSGVFSTTDPSAWDSAGSPAGSLPNKAYDRIVQLEVDAINGEAAPPAGAGGLLQVAAMVLGGGALPNYPERDLVDNDADNAVLSRDFVDNDMYEELDPATGSAYFGVDRPTDILNRGLEGIDEGDRRLVAAGGAKPPEFGRLVPPAGWVNALFSANIFGLQPGSYGFRHHPIRFGRPGLGERQTILPVLDYSDQGNLDLAFNDSPEFKTFVEERWYPGDNVIVTLYVGPPNQDRIADRVTYSERDVVNRQIHEGIPANIAFDASLPSTFNPAIGLRIPVPIEPNVGDALEREPLFDGPFSGAGFGDQLSDLVTIEATWPDDTMAVDFYRSLERRHPLDRGDRHGTTNRWEPTDGNYDDWTHGWGRKQYDYGSPPFINVQPTIAEGLAMRWDGLLGNGTLERTGERTLTPDERQIAHQLEASPLRMNYFARYLENPRVGNEPGIWSQPEDLTSVPTAITVNPDAGRQFKFAETFQESSHVRDPYPAPPVFIPANGPGRGELKRWTFSKALVRNRPFTSAGDLMTLPAFTLFRNFFAGSNPLQTNPPGFPFVKGKLPKQGTPFSLEEAGQEPSGLERYRLDGVLLAEAFKEDWTAITAVTKQEPLELNAGQASVYYPTGTPGRVDWVDQAPLDLPPEEWMPLFLFSFDAPQETGTVLQVTASPNAPDLGTPFQTPVVNFPRRTLFAQLMSPVVSPPAAVNAQPLVLIDRYPPEKRIVAYVSGNRFAANALDPNLPPSSFADVLFEWDGDDGLENGEYRAYVVTAIPLDGLRRGREEEIAALGSARDFYTSEGNSFIDLSDDVDPSTLAVDIEFYTDRDGNRRAWPTLEYPRDPGVLDRGSSLQESLGALTGVTPNSEGIIPFGTVKVENNYLALRLRNKATPGRLNRFTKVVLAPKHRSRGLININTAQSARRSTRGDSAVGIVLHNPLMGLPGLLTRPEDVRADGNDLPPPPGTADFRFDFDNNGVDDTWVTNPNGKLFEPLGLLPEATLNTFQLNPAVAANDGLFDLRRELTSAEFDDDGDPDNPGSVRENAMSIASRIREFMPDWGDGRYYRFPGDLYAYAQNLPGGTRIENQAPHFANEYPREIDFDVIFLPPLPPFTPPREGKAAVAAYGDIRYPAGPFIFERNNYRFEEASLRLSRMFNGISTRSDVFEIIVTAQSGYVDSADQPKGGLLQYRQNFQVLGERKVRVVYER